MGGRAVNAEVAASDRDVILPKDDGWDDEAGGIPLGASFGRFQTGNDVVVEVDGESTGFDFDVGDGLGEAAVAVADDVALGDAVEGDVREAAGDALGVHIFCFFIGSAHGADDFIGGHADGDFLAGDEFFDFLLAGGGLLESVEELGVAGFEEGEADPADDGVVGGAAADATGFFVEGDEFDGLSCDELAEAAAAGEVGVGGGGLA